MIEERSCHAARASESALKLSSHYTGARSDGGMSRVILSDLCLEVTLIAFYVLLGMCQPPLTSQCKVPCHAAVAIAKCHRQCPLVVSSASSIRRPIYPPDLPFVTVEDILTQLFINSIMRLAHPKSKLILTLHPRRIPRPTHPISKVSSAVTTRI